MPEFAIIQGIVCKSNEKDCENDLLTREDIQQLYDHNHDLLFDINHNEERLNRVLMITNQIDDGDWVVSVLSNNRELNKQLLNKELTGFSLESSLDTRVCRIDGCTGECEYKDYNISCWEPIYLSFVDNPCNNKPFTSLKFFNEDGEALVWI